MDFKAEPISGSTNELKIFVAVSATWNTASVLCGCAVPSDAVKNNQTW